MAAVAVLSCAPAEPASGDREAIAGGMIEPGYPGVVAVYNSAIMGLCTGTLIAPRVVLTAKHCVQNQGSTTPSPASAFTVEIGGQVTAPSATYRVVTVRTTPQPFNSTNDLTNHDVALLTLERAVTGVDPIPYRTDVPHDQVGMSVLVIGYGETPAGGAGVKYSGHTRVTSVVGNEIYASGTTCHGDSGGPMLDSMGRVFGVTSWGAGTCGSGFDAHNGISDPAIVTMIDAAIMEGASCRNDGPEVCDGADNDCNGMIDETCTAVGATCNPVRDVCYASLPCEMTPIGMICVQPCDPLRPLLGCPPGDYCAMLDKGSCGGGCIPGAAPDAATAKPVGAACGADTECATMLCTDPGDGMRRCLQPCRAGAAGCLSGEACAALPGSCNACVSEAILSGARGIGETCTADADCGTGKCFDDLGVQYCTQPCSMDSECPGTFHCRSDVGFCANGRREGEGGSCVTNADCDPAAQICANRGDTHWCTPLCDLPDPHTGMTGMCSMGFDCTVVPGSGHSLCIPSGHLVGESCAMDAECISGTCAMGACTRVCSADTPCAAGTECVRAADGSASCRRPPPPPTMMMPVAHGGCSVSRAGGSGGALALLGLVFGLVVVRRRRVALAAAAVSALAALSGCASGPVGPEVSGSAAPIVGGALDRGDPSVVWVYNAAPGSSFGASCTGSVIAPRVILTARHCVADFTTSGSPIDRVAPVSHFTVFAGVAPGHGSFTEMHGVSEVRIPPSPPPWDVGDGSDVAILILSTPTGLTPLPYAHGTAGSLIGMNITAIGYGQRPDGSSGVKYKVDAPVLDVRPHFLIVDRVTCEGDSGGPAIAPDGNIYAVVSFGTSPDGMSAPTCGGSIDWYTLIAPWLTSLIDPALMDTGTCVPASEVCNGLDDNCDGTIDEGCSMFGAACTDASQCASMTCTMTTAGRVCTQACNPRTPGIVCPAGYYCGRTTACDGLCVPGSAGAKAPGEACAADTECDSLLCLDPGDGHRRCLAPCEAGSGGCDAGEACAALPGECGGCVDATLLPPPRHLGEPCAMDGDCADAHCVHEGLTSYCSHPCAADTDCTVGYRCRGGVCHHGTPETTGGPCATNEDCAAPGVCATVGERSWCTVSCTSPAGCPSGYTCAAAGGGSVCAPALALVGEHCTDSTGCTTGLCELGSGTCTRVCDASQPCPSGFDCRRAGTVSVCLRPAAPPAPPRGGCGIVPGAGASGLAALLFGAAAGALASRRKRGVTR